MKLVVSGAAEVSDVPGLSAALNRLEISCAEDQAALARELPGAELLLGWNFRGRDLAEAFPHADNLKWIHWCGAGVDAVLFPGLVDSGVTLTNARGCFDRAMAEFVLGYILAHAKGFDQMFKSQAERRWYYRMTERIHGTNALIYGVGSIAREVAQVLGGVGVNVAGVGRTARRDVPVFGEVHSSDTADAVLSDADWVIGVLPGTIETRNYFDGGFFSKMKPTARFINIGRGTSVDQADLVSALEKGVIAGAGLDVFATEPLSQDDPVWGAPNLIMSPHISGDYIGHKEDMVTQFLDNLERYVNGQPLENVVDKEAGYVRD